MEVLTNLAPFLIVFVFFYFAFIRPQNQKEQEQKKIISDIKVNDEILTSFGLLGSIEKVGQEYIVLNTGSGTIKLRKDAILKVLPKGTINNINYDK